MRGNGPTKTYWKSITTTSILGFLLGVFFIFSPIGLINDILNLGTEPELRLAMSFFLAGLFAAFYALAGFVLRRRFWMALIPAFVAQFALMFLLGRWMPTVNLPVPMGAAEIARMQSRLTLDGVGAMCAIGLGYGCFLFVTITETRRYVREHAEMLLAAEIHRVLVPAIDTRIGEFEFYGRAMPSGEVGGDLIDLAGTDEHWVAYVADVSGHGVAPGVVMGMVKSAARMLLSSGDDTKNLLGRLNEVLYPLKKPDMFVTFSFLAKNEGGLQVGLAGHPAILRFSAATNEVKKWESPNLPLGILPSVDFAVDEIRAEPGDVFALYTDGLLETTNAAGEEFGLKRLEMEIQKHGRDPLDVICRSLQESVARHGAQADDQSLLLVRRVRRTEGAEPMADFGRRKS